MPAAVTSPSTRRMTLYTLTPGRCVGSCRWTIETWMTSSVHPLSPASWRAVTPVDERDLVADLPHRPPALREVAERRVPHRDRLVPVPHPPPGRDLSLGLVPVDPETPQAHPTEHEVGLLRLLHHALVSLERCLLRLFHDATMPPVSACPRTRGTPVDERRGWPVHVDDEPPRWRYPRAPIRSLIPPPGRWGAADEEPRTRGPPTRAKGGPPQSTRSLRAYRASAADFCGRHQASLYRYQSIVAASPASKSRYRGCQPSSSRSRVQSMA